MPTSLRESGSAITQNLNAYLNHLNLSQVLQMGMQVLPAPIEFPASNVWNTVVACSRFWILFYALWLLFMDMFFTIFPTTLIFIIILTLVLHYTKISTPPIQFVNAIFGLDPNIQAAAAYNRFASKIPNRNKAIDLNYDDENSGKIRDLATAILGTTLNGVLPLPLVAGATNPTVASMAFNVLKKTLELHADVNQSQNQNQDQNQDQRHNQQTKNDQRVKSSISGSSSGSSSNRSSFDGYLTPTPDQLLEQGVPQSLEAQLSNIPVAVIARRGAGLDVPENTLKAITHCKQTNCHFVHFDVRLAKDNVAIVFHDRDLIRLAGIDKKVRYMTSQEIRNIDVSLLHPLGQRYRGAMVPSFEEAIESCIKQNIKFFFNVVGSSRQMVEIVLRAYQRYNAMYSMAVLTSFNWKLVYKIRRQDPKIIACLATPYAHRNKPCHALEPGFNEILLSQHQGQHHANSSGIAFIDWYHYINDNFQDWLLDSFLWWYLGICAILIEKEAVSKSYIREWGSRGIHTFLWSVNNPVEKLYLNQVLKVGYLTDTVANDPVLHPHLDPTVALLKTSDFSRYQHFQRPNSNNSTTMRRDDDSNRNESNKHNYSSVLPIINTNKHKKKKKPHLSDTDDDLELMSIPSSRSETDNESYNSVDLVRTLNEAAAKLEKQRQQQPR